MIPPNDTTYTGANRLSVGGLGSLLCGLQREANFVLILVAVILIVLVVRVGGRTTRVGVAGL